MGLSGRQKTALQAGDFQGLANLERLYLDGNSLTELPDGVFHGLSNLEWLDLYGNSLTELPDGVFDGLSNLEYLYLDGNSLSELPDGVFNGLSNLEWLYLGSNDLTTLPDGVFDGLSNLEFLYLQSNDLTELPDGVFGGLSTLGTLDLRENDLTGLPEGVFDSLDSLEFLYLQSNDLTGLPEGAFDELTNLESLEFSYNDLTQLRADVFNGLSKLESLEFSYNDLTALPANVFDGLSSLENLDLNLNYLSKLPDGVFDGLSSLEDLSLGGNYLTALPADVFKGLSNLEYLSLSANDLTALPADVFNGLSNLEYLSLSANDLTALPADVFKGLSNLEYLSLSANDLTALPAGVFKGLSNLEYLSLSANDLTELPVGVFKGLADLEWLLLNGNDLTELPAGVFEGLSSLRSVDLQDNPGAPFTLTVELEQRGDDAFVVKVAHGTPSDMTVTLVAQGGTLSGTTVTIDRGSVTSEEISVTPDDTRQVTIGFESVAFNGVVISDLDETDLIVSQKSRSYKGIQIGFGEPLVLGDAESVNTPATGAPTISGTAQVGETLTVDTSGIADADGLTGVTFSYQWLSSRDTAIQGATGATYTLRSDDAGKAIKVRVSFTDRGGYAESLTSSPVKVDGEAEAQADKEAPTVSSLAITSSPNDDAVTVIDGEKTKVGDWRVYGIDDTIEVTVAFSAGVTITGNPRLELDVGGSAKAAGYKGTDGNNVKFSYTVAENDEDTDGVSIRANKLTLNGGTIRGEAAEKDADLSHDALSTQDKHKVDGIRPSFQGIRFSGSNTYNLNGYYEEGEEVFIKVQFSEEDSIYVSGTPQLTIDVGGKEKKAAFERTGFGDFFLYTVQEGDLDLDGPSFSANSVNMNGGYIRDGAGNDIKLNHGGASAGLNSRVDAVVPTVSAVAITSDPGADDTYAAGDTVEVSVTFSEEVWVPDVTRSDLPGTRHPVLDLRIGNDTRSAKSGLQELGKVVIFTYTIQSGDTDTDGISINANGLRLNGGVIFDDAGNNPISAEIHLLPDIPLDAVIPHDGLADDPGHKVTTYKNPATGLPTVSGTARVGETLTADTSGIADADGLSGATFSYQWLSSRDTDIQGATGASYTLVPADAGKTIKVRVGFTDDANNEETLTSAPTATVAASPDSGPAVAIGLAPSGSVAEGTEIALTMSFGGLESDSDTSDTDYIFRADVVDADACEGGGMGNDRYMYKVDEDPEVRAATISAACPPGDYTIEVSISSPADVELASATADFTVAAPAQQRQAQEPPPSTDATLSGLRLSDVTLAFASTTTEYTASVGNEVDANYGDPYD